MPDLLEHGRFDRARSFKVKKSAPTRPRGLLEHFRFPSSFWTPKCSSKRSAQCFLHFFISFLASEPCSQDEELNVELSSSWTGQIHFKHCFFIFFAFPGFRLLVCRLELHSRSSRGLIHVFCFAASFAQSVPRLVSVRSRVRFASLDDSRGGIACTF